MSGWTVVARRRFDELTEQTLSAAAAHRWVGNSGKEEEDDRRGDNREALMDRREAGRTKSDARFSQSRKKNPAASGGTTKVEL